MDEYVKANNCGAWAIGRTVGNGRFQVRRVVWGILLARHEKREGEYILRALVHVRKPARKPKK